MLVKESRALIKNYVKIIRRFKHHTHFHGISIDYHAFIILICSTFIQAFNSEIWLLSVVCVFHNFNPSFMYGRVHDCFKLHIFNVNLGCFVFKKEFDGLVTLHNGHVVIKKYTCIRKNTKDSLFLKHSTPLPHQTHALEPVRACVRVLVYMSVCVFVCETESVWVCGCETERVSGWINWWMGGFGGRACACACMFVCMNFLITN